jgi:hypothetical protein
MIIPIEEAREILRLDGDDNDDIIRPLLLVMPDYLKTTTGYKPNRNKYSHLAITTARFLLQLWYNPEGIEAERLQRVINNLLTALTVTVKKEK